MREKNFYPLNMPTMLFLICLQIFLNLHSTIVGNDARQTAGLTGHTPSKDNDYWLYAHELFLETLSLPVAVHPVILAYYPLTPLYVRNEISRMIKECGEKNLSQSDFNELQIEIAKMLAIWKYKHSIETLTAALVAVHEKQKSLITKSAGSSEPANYEDLYETFLQFPVPDEKKEDLWPPLSMRNSSEVPSNLQLAIQELPVWCRLKAGVLVHAIKHFPEKWHTYSYKRLVKALENYYYNKKEIEACEESDEEKAICLREVEEYLALNLTAEIIEYTAYFEKREIRSIGLDDLGSILTLHLESFTYPDVLELAQGLPPNVHEPLVILYECFRLRRKNNVDEIAELQKSLHSVLTTYVNTEENETIVTDSIQELFQTCRDLEGPAVVVREAIFSKKLNRRYSSRVPSSFAVQNPPSTVGPRCSFVDQETGQTSASVEQGSDAGEGPLQFSIGDSIHFNIGGSGVVINPIAGSNAPGKGGAFNINFLGKGPNEIKATVLNKNEGVVNISQSYKAKPANWTSGGLSADSLNGNGMCKIFLYNSFYEMYFSNQRL